MMVTFVSQCEKNALKKTRRVLDTFANRIGDRTWQTVITSEGLKAVKKLLRKTASKNTAVACHWMRTRYHSELVWIVGNRSCFNHRGWVPVHSTQHSDYHPEWENDWEGLPLIKCLTALSALFHDWGKASECFQKKLDVKNSNRIISDPLRHEWVSTLLLNAYVNGESDERWLVRLAEGNFDEQQLRETTQKNLKTPLNNLPPVASLVAWLVVTHHKLPQLKSKEANNEWRGETLGTLSEMFQCITQAWGYENKQEEADYQKRVKECLSFPKGLPNQSLPWRKQIKKWANRTQAILPKLEQAFQDGSWRVYLHHARLCLMLGDHHFSSLDGDPLWEKKSRLELIANTYRDAQPKLKKAKGEAKQKLDEHLVGVANHALQTAHLLATYQRNLPYARDVQSLKRKGPKAFHWQEKAVHTIKKYYTETEKSKSHGFFLVNMASTGCGKTMANAKVMQVLSEDQASLRYILALGLRTLTLQTGEEYRERIGLQDDELAVLIGSQAVKDLHFQQKLTPEEETESWEAFGSESSETLLDEDVDYDGTVPEQGLITVLQREKDRHFFYAPVLACTIDHLMAATETKRGGRYILPSLRLMSSDLVIDEIDDFNGSDLIAIGRLIHLAGMLGRKVMISSATIPPDLAIGYFNCYRAGWRLYSQTRSVSATVACAWIDEFRTRVVPISETEAEEARQHYQDQHQTFIAKRVNDLQKTIKEGKAKRKGEIIECHELTKEERTAELDETTTLEQAYFTKIQQAILDLHHHNHVIDHKTEKPVSFGVVRMANIPPCIALTEYLMTYDWPESVAVKVMAYHSQQVLLLRSVQETHLDQVLKRKNTPKDQKRTIENRVIRQHLDQSGAEQTIFILVATPVEEVGRDHDFDWAVVEPSSYRSIIQLAGRVLRHRDIVPQNPNMRLLQYNLRALKQGAQRAAYCRPGYEGDGFREGSLRLDTHDLKTLLDETKLSQGITAVPRIQRPKTLAPQTQLADLEHHTIEFLLNYPNHQGPENMQGWLTQYWWLTALPQFFNPFRQGVPSLKLHLIWDDDMLVFQEKNSLGKWISVEKLYGIHRLPLNAQPERLWLQRDYEQLIETKAEQLHLTQREVSQKYGEISVPQYGDRLPDMKYSDQLGLCPIRKT